jgi:hypothetical protein
MLRAASVYVVDLKKLVTIFAATCTPTAVVGQHALAAFTPVT